MWSALRKGTTQDKISFSNNFLFFTLPENIGFGFILISYVYVVAMCKLSLWAQTIARTHNLANTKYAHFPKSY